MGTSGLGSFSRRGFEEFLARDLPLGLQSKLENDIMAVVGSPSTHQVKRITELARGFAVQILKLYGNACVDTGGDSGQDVWDFFLPGGLVEAARGDSVEDFLSSIVPGGLMGT